MQKRCYDHDSRISFKNSKNCKLLGAYFLKLGGKTCQKMVKMGLFFSRFPPKCLVEECKMCKKVSLVTIFPRLLCFI